MQKQSVYILNLFKLIINFYKDIEDHEEAELLVKSIALIQW